MSPAQLCGRSENTRMENDYLCNCFSAFWLTSSENKLSIWTSRTRGNTYETKYKNNNHHPQKEVSGLKIAMESFGP